jgi:thiopeptide-type bacteriocin biosynthesis protein
MHAAEAVFAADSQVVTVALRHASTTTIRPVALAAINMVDITEGFLGSRAEAMRWLADHPTSAARAADRGTADQAVRWAMRSSPQDLPEWPREVAEAWRTRVAALATYRTLLRDGSDTDSVMESLFHMHHNRALGIDPDQESTCRQLARQIALAWQAQRTGNDQ